MIGTVILLIAIGGVSMALVCGSSHAGYTVVDTADDDDTAHHAAEDEVEETQDELSAKGDGCYNEVCANCGEQGSDTVKLKNCNACHLVKYCGVGCQKAHRKLHKKVCKQRAAELKEEQLYSQGDERPEGDTCPICT